MSISQGSGNNLRNNGITGKYICNGGPEKAAVLFLHDNPGKRLSGELINFRYILKNLLKLPASR